jgi:hypothetical protein
MSLVLQRAKTITINQFYSVASHADSASATPGTLALPEGIYTIRVHVAQNDDVTIWLYEDVNGAGQSRQELFDGVMDTAAAGGHRDFVHHLGNDFDIVIGDNATNADVAVDIWRVDASTIAPISGA